MSLWARTSDDLDRIERDAKQQADGLTFDQRIQIAQARALLSISQELSMIQDQGIQPKWTSRSD